MAEASLQKESPPIFLVEDSISSKESVPVLHEPRDSTGKKACSSQRKQEKGKQQLIRRLGRQRSCQT